MKLDSSTLLLSVAWAFICTVCTLAVVASAPTVIGPPPYLSVASQQSYFLAKNETWKPGMITQVALLMAGTPLTMQIELSEGRTDLGSPSFYLLYKCSPDDKEFSEVDLQNGTSSTAAAAKISGNDSTALCKQLQPCVVSGLQDAPNGYNITLLATTNGSIKFEDSLRHSLELGLLVRYSRGQLQSRSLFIFNWDALPELDTVQRTMSYGGRGVKYTRYILTDEAIRYLLEITETGKNELKRLQFLDGKFVKLVASSSVLVRANLAVTVLMKFGYKRSCSSGLELLSDVVISTDEPFVFNNNFKSFAHVLSSLDIKTGILHVTDWSFKQLAYSPIISAVTVCLRLSINSEVWDYHVTKTVLVVALPASKPIGSPAQVPKNPKDPKCRVDGGLSRATVSLIAGMQNVVLRSPIVCEVTNLTGASHLVFFNKTGCMSTPHNAKQVNQHVHCLRYETIESRAAIMLTGNVNLSHSGTYIFRTQEVQFEYVVSVLSLPVFTTESGMYQPETQSNPHSWLFNLTCRASHSAIEPRIVSMAPLFRLATADGLQDLSADDFAQVMLGLPPRVVVQAHSRGPYSSTLSSYAGYHELVRASSDTRFIVVCRAYLEAADTRRLFGIGQYQAETHSVVTYYVYRRIPLRSGRISAASYWLISVSCCAAAAVVLAAPAPPLSSLFL